MFSQTVVRPEDLEATAQRCYRDFLGKSWRDTDGAATWMAVWRPVYERHPTGRRDIVAELRSIADPEVRSSVGLLLEGHKNPDAAIEALSAVYDDPAMAGLQVYALGDGAALSGVLIAGRALSGTATFLVFLMD